MKFITLFFILFFLSCSEPKSNNEMAKIKGKIEFYLENGMHDSFEGGGFESFDVVKIKVKKPKKRKGDEITIYINKKKKTTIDWSKIGTDISFEIDKDFLEDVEGVFVDALEKIKIND